MNYTDNNFDVLKLNDVIIFSTKIFTIKYVVDHYSSFLDLGFYLESYADNITMLNLINYRNILFKNGCNSAYGETRILTYSDSKESINNLTMVVKDLFNEIEKLNAVHN